MVSTKTSPDLPNCFAEFALTQQTSTVRIENIPGHGMILVAKRLFSPSVNSFSRQKGTGGTLQIIDWCVSFPVPSTLTALSPGTGDVECFRDVKERDQEQLEITFYNVGVAAYVYALKVFSS